MIIDYDHNPVLSTDQKLQSLAESVQRALIDEESAGSQKSAETHEASDVTVTQIVSTGTHIADITVGSDTTELYAPEGSGGSEVDPVFTASPAYAITDNDITAWNQAEPNVNADWNASSGDAQILNKPSLGTASSKDTVSSISSDSNNVPTVTAVKDYLEDLGIFYGTCSTAKITVAKEATVPGVTELKTGVTIAVKFTYENKAASPTLKVNSLDAKSIMRYGTTAPSNTEDLSWRAGSVVTFTYDGTYWQMHDWNNTTYEVMSSSEMATGTATDPRVITAARLKSAVSNHAPVKSVNGNTGFVTLSIPSKTSDLTNDDGFTAVSLDRKISSGTNICDITIDGTTTEIYAPSTSSLVADVQVNGTSVVSNNIASIDTILSGTTAQVTPTQVYQALQDGKNVEITYTDSTWQDIDWHSFTYIEDTDSIVGSVVMKQEVSLDTYRYWLFELKGDLSDDSWEFDWIRLIDDQSLVTVRHAITPTGATNYANYGDSYYQTCCDGHVVHVHVGVVGLTANTAVIIATLPLGVRPSTPIFAHGTGGSWNNIGYIEIRTNGDIYVRSQGVGCGADAFFMV